MATEWQMPRAGKACAACEHAFDIGEEFRAALYETADGYERQDYCQSCAPRTQPAPVGTWLTHRPAPVSKKTQPFDRQVVYEFFRRLEPAGEPEKVQLRFVVALLLWRRKVLKFERAVAEGGHEYWEFRATGADDQHRVSRPDLDEEELQRLSEQLEQLMAGAPGGTSETTATAGEEGVDG